VDSQKHSANALRVAIETLNELLGQNTVEVIIADFEKQGLVFTKNAQYSIPEIQNALESHFGDQMALFLLRHIAKGMCRKLD
jgi:DNA-binding winged helix-turn-helix (wHTH) protein